MKSKYNILLLVLFLLCVIALPGRGAHAAVQTSEAQWNSSLHLFSLSAAGTGWQYKDGNWYYIDSDGSRHTGWLYDGGKWYYLNGSGVMQTGWLSDRGTWYYLDRSGAMKTGWLNDRGTWYFLDGSGAMKTGWLQDNGKWYYLDTLKVMLTILVVFHHAAEAYSPYSAWVYKPSNKEEMMPLIWHFNSVNAAFFMGLFFFIAGYFVPRSYDKQGRNAA